MKTARRVQAAGRNRAEMPPRRLPSARSIVIVEDAARGRRQIKEMFVPTIY